MKAPPITNSLLGQHSEPGRLPQGQRGFIGTDDTETPFQVSDISLREVAMLNNQDRIWLTTPIR